MYVHLYIFNPGAETRFGPRAVLLKGGHLPGVSGAGEGAKEAVKPETPHPKLLFVY